MTRSEEIKARNEIFAIFKSNNVTVYEAQEILEEVKLLLMAVKVK